jgi:hypothetical protein
VLNAATSEKGTDLFFRDQINLSPFVAFVEAQQQGVTQIDSAASGR